MLLYSFLCNLALVTSICAPPRLRYARVAYRTKMGPATPQGVGCFHSRPKRIGEPGKDRESLEWQKVCHDMAGISNSYALVVTEAGLDVDAVKAGPANYGVDFICVGCGHLQQWCHVCHTHCYASHPYQRQHFRTTVTSNIIFVASVHAVSITSAIGIVVTVCWRDQRHQHNPCHHQRNQQMRCRSGRPRHRRRCRHCRVVTSQSLSNTIRIATIIVIVVIIPGSVIVIVVAEPSATT